jgi:hypothetical protein
LPCSATKTHVKRWYFLRTLYFPETFFFCMRTLF